MHRVRRGVAVSDDDASRLVEAAPLGLIAGVPVHRIEAGRRIGVDVVGLVAELTGEVHLYQRTGIALVVRECDLHHFAAALGQMGGQQLCLGGLAGAVQPFDDKKPALAHSAFSPFSAAYWARTSAVRPQHILPSGQGPDTQAGPAVRKIWGATG